MLGASSLSSRTPFYTDPGPKLGPGRGNLQRFRYMPRMDPQEFSFTKELRNSSGIRPTSSEYRTNRPGVAMAFTFYVRPEIEPIFSRKETDYGICDGIPAFRCLFCVSSYHRSDNPESGNGAALGWILDTIQIFPLVHTRNPDSTPLLVQIQP
jgi:hypothetical protein